MFGDNFYLAVEDIKVSPHVDDVVVVADEFAVDLALGQALAASGVDRDPAVLGDVEVLRGDLGPRAHHEEAQDQGLAHRGPGTRFTNHFMVLRSVTDS